MSPEPQFPIPPSAPEIWANKSRAFYIPTFSPKLNAFLGGGLRAKGTYVCTGSPGVGKTTFALEIADAAVAYGCPVVYVSTELDPELVVARYASKRLGIGWLEAIDTEEPEKVEMLNGFVEALGSMFFVINPDTAPNYAELINNLRQRLNNQHQCVMPILIVIDYIQDLALTRIDKYREPRIAVSTLSRELRSFAQKHAVPIWIVSSTGRRMYDGSQEEHSDDALLAAAKESGEIEYNVNAVLHIRRKDAGKIHNLEIVGAKNRFGENPFSVVFNIDPKTGTMAESHMNGGDVLFAANVMRVWDLIKIHPGKFSGPKTIAQTLKMKILDTQAVLDTLFVGYSGFKIASNKDGLDGLFVLDIAPVEALT